MLFLGSSKGSWGFLQSWMVTMPFLELRWECAGIWWIIGILRTGASDGFQKGNGKVNAEEEKEKKGKRRTRRGKSCKKHKIGP